MKQTQQKFVTNCAMKEWIANKSLV